MTLHTFSLQPLPIGSFADRLEITGQVSREGGRLGLQYRLQGSLEGLSLPAPVATPGRKDALWKKSCFEFFLALQPGSGYREFNFSPSTDWNVYCFSAYRQGMREDPAFASLPFRVQRSPAALSLALELDLDPIVPPARSVQVAIAAVLMDADGSLSYWALAHAGPQADFHRRETFLLAL